MIQHRILGMRRYILSGHYILTLLGSSSIVNKMTKWDGLIERLKVEPAHSDIAIRKSKMPRRPRAFMPRVGLPLEADHYSKPLRGGGGIHLKDYPTHYELHRDHADANTETLKHLWKDTSNSDRALIAIGLYALNKYAFDGRVANWVSNILKSILGVSR